MGTCAEPSIGAWTHHTGLKQAVVEQRLLTVFIVTCALGLAVVLNLFQ